MKRIATMAGLLILGSALAVPVAHAGGGRPPAPGVPLGSTLLQTMQATVQRQGTFHLDGQVGLLSSSQTRIQLHVAADLGLHPLALHEVVTARGTRLDQHPAAATTQTVDEIATGQTVALRLGTAAWQCRSVPSLVQQVHSLIGTPQLASAQTMGTGIVGGTRVWLVQVMLALSLNGTPERLPVTYAVNQTTNLPVQASASLRLPVKGQMIQETLLFRYSNFGEPVNVTLPAACS